MLFNSFSFILLFLPITLIVYFSLNNFNKERFADIFIIAMSLFFYSRFGINVMLIMCASVVVNYLFSMLMEHFNKEAQLKTLKIAGVVANLAFLFYFKYYDFFVGSAVKALGMNYESAGIIMPVGISFYTFQQMSFIIDRGRKQAKHYSFADYALYVTFFPKLIEGPISFHEEIISQFKDKANRVFNRDNFQKGLILFVLGLSKKVLLADNLNLIVTYGFKYTHYLDTLSVIAVMLSYTFQIYFDFSGYCDMASGIALMMNIKLPMNFNSPYKAATVKELWQRWHMTLSRFFVKYVYIPLGGSRKGKIRTIINVLIVFILSGLWHGAGWTYICWGLMQGLLVVWDDIGIVEVNGSSKGKYLFRQKPLIKVPRFIGQIFTFSFFVISLFFFGAKDMEYAISMFKRLFYFTYPGFFVRCASTLDIAENYILSQAITMVAPGMTDALYIGTMVILLIICFIVNSRKNAYEIAMTQKPTKKMAIGLSVLFIWSFISLSQVSTFIYFQF
ncbi:MAG: MBOAT family protein [Butyrivibrio sp.]|nr:MBOAT family protein [Butyrivibrio sp.]